jgi:hypothetical protein
MMAKHRRETNRSGKVTNLPSKAGQLKEQLKQLSSDQLAEIIEKFLAQLSEKQRLEFLNLLPSVKSHDLEIHLPYNSDEDFLAEIEDFCERVRSEEFIEYGVGYDREEDAHHGFGDDSWIGEMDELFETAELYFLAHHYSTVENAYQLLFDCLMIQSYEGGFYFTTSDPQGALHTDLIKARRHYFDALRHLYAGSELAERIVDGMGEYRYIGSKPPEVQELFPEGGEVIQLADYKARAAEQLGDQTAMLGSLWDAFNNEANVDRYVALRKTAIASGQWKAYYPRIIQRLTHNFSRGSYTLGQLWDNRLLVEALLAEGEYERALEQVSRGDYSSWDKKGDARKSLVDFFLHSVTRSTGKDVDAAKYPEIARRLGRAAEFIKRLGEELFQESLTDKDRDRQIDWIIRIVRPRIDQIVGGKRQGEYAAAAHDAKLIVELYLLQGKSDRAQRLIRGLHIQYPRHRNFRTELKNLGLL